MAYELLNMGYPIIYFKIDKIKDLVDTNKWEIFKDKASYDFRFITHGLLSSSTSTSITKLENAIKLLNDNITNLNLTPDTDTAKLVLTAEQNAQYSALLGELKDGILPGMTSSVTDCKEVCGLVVTALKLHTAALSDYGIDSSSFNTANKIIADLATYDADTDKPGRGDCIALIELDETTYKNATVNPENNIIEAINKMTIADSSGKYCALTVPSVTYKMTDNASFSNNKKFPGAFHYLACFMSSLKAGFAEWYAAAGYTRGVSNYIIDHTTVTLGEIAINALEPRNVQDSSKDPKFACNVIANFRGSYYLWGNRTAHKLGDAGGTTGDLVASHFLNIRQLCTTIKKQLYVSCRRFTFDPNSDTLWINFVNAIKPTLEEMKADQGIRDYKILKVHTDKKATLKAKIRIIPIEAVEDFDLEISLEDSFGEATAAITE
jgi:hypothetical protein